MTPAWMESTCACSEWMCGVDKWTGRYPGSRDSWPDSRNLSPSWQRERTPGGNVSSPHLHHSSHWTPPPVHLLSLYLSVPFLSNPLLVTHHQNLNHQWVGTAEGPEISVLMRCCPLLDVSLYCSTHHVAELVGAGFHWNKDTVISIRFAFMCVKMSHPPYRVSFSHHRKHNPITLYSAWEKSCIMWVWEDPEQYHENYVRDRVLQTFSNWALRIVMTIWGHGTWKTWTLSWQRKNSDQIYDSNLGSGV